MANTERGRILETALNLTEGDRNASYGDPLKNLTCFAELCNAYLNGITDEMADLNAVDGAIFMVLAKVSRVAANKDHADNYTDMAAYAAIAGECAYRLAEKQVVAENRCTAFELPPSRPVERYVICPLCKQEFHIALDRCPRCKYEEGYLPTRSQTGG